MKFNYMMLSRLQSDCEYFLNYGNCSINQMYYNQMIRKLNRKQTNTLNPKEILH